MQPGGFTCNAWSRDRAVDGLHDGEHDADFDERPCDVTTEQRDDDCGNRAYYESQIWNHVEHAGDHRNEARVREAGNPQTEERQHTHDQSGDELTAQIAREQAVVFLNEWNPGSP